MQTEINEIKRLIRDIPDFPEKGVIFKDITPLLKNPRVFRISLDKI
jgi:adenine phosphoribosyltransferase